MTKKSALLQWVQALPDDADIWMESTFLMAGDDHPYCEVGPRLELIIKRLAAHIWEIWDGDTNLLETRGSQDECEDFLADSYPGKKFTLVLDP